VKRKKITPGQPNPGNPLSKNKASYKTLILTYPYAVVIPLTLMCNPTRTLPNPDLPPEGVFDGFLYLRADP
jgi:hypothetical protein